MTATTVTTETTAWRRFINPGLESATRRAAEPKACERCAGSGLVEVYVFGVREIRCTGVDDSGNCDDGIVR